MAAFGLPAGRPFLVDRAELAVSEAAAVAGRVTQGPIRRLSNCFQYERGAEERKLAHGSGAFCNTTAVARCLGGVYPTAGSARAAGAAIRNINTASAARCGETMAMKGSFRGSGVATRRECAPATASPEDEIGLNRVSASGPSW